ncbi:MAG TPA: NUDIX domain-containing protein [Terriglobales bacterium]|nr:NUDIX domain-containing protein [Terriglobales bacterium]
MAAAKLQLVRTFKRWGRPLSEVLLPEKSGRSRKREQVAAVCYRLRKLKIQFLLVRTRKERWTFPKGGVVKGLTRAHSAALEAFEEAGVHGRIEEASFARYILRKGVSAESEGETVTYAHLCEVLQLGTPQEPNRHPTWFSPEKAKLHLQERRSHEDGLELARVVDRAVARLQRLATQNAEATRNISTARDPLQKINLESRNNKPGQLIARVALVPFLAGQAATSVVEFNSDSRKVFRLGPARTNPRS